MAVPARSTMRARDYDRAIAVLDRCVDVESVECLQQELLEALGSVYGCRHTAFFRTAAFTRTFADPDPVMNGRIPGIIDEYRERWFGHDVMFTRESMDRIRDSGVSALIQLEPRRIPDAARAYLDHFVFRRGLHSVCALDLDLPEGSRGVVGIFHEGADELAAADLAGFSVIVRQLSAVSRRLPAAPPAVTLDVLTPRLREVAALVGEGATNAAIARRTGLTLDTVKKYVSQILERTGCANRTELALLAVRPQRRDDSTATGRHSQATGRQ
ncbi:MAG: helix-turn-helix transcriptional regulator [Pseudonocardia sp.]|uniref:response regulator transcription factor n=1 Tax=unclassified Pseudonocardia TaxID=2619320 RepID=UPI001AC28735|nr:MULTISPECIES: helix-turn-helix transcriptional regulator [unclassified Pseudonocardia]MBN9111765.1 helix-turn-helix transcriptional regulator [Pseudonocardia sp.]